MFLVYSIPSTNEYLRGSLVVAVVAVVPVDIAVSAAAVAAVVVAAVSPGLLILGDLDGPKSCLFVNNHALETNIQHKQTLWKLFIHLMTQTD